MSDQLRIGDAERDNAAQALGEHYATGRISKEEYEERSEQVWAARFQADLEPLFADLPSPWARVPEQVRPVRLPPARPRQSPRPFSPGCRGYCSGCSGWPPFPAAGHAALVSSSPARRLSAPRHRGEPDDLLTMERRQRIGSLFRLAPDPPRQRVELRELDPAVPVSPSAGD